MVKPVSAVSGIKYQLLPIDMNIRLIKLGAAAESLTPGKTFQDELTELKVMYQNVVAENPNNPHLVVLNRGKEPLVVLQW